MAHRFGLLLAAVIAAAGCSSAPPVRYHTLMPAEPPARAIGSSAPTPIVLEPIRLPAQVDQPQWLVRLADGNVAVLEQDRWASPLRDELRQALLEQLIGGYGATESRAATSPLTRISLDVRRFDGVAGRESRIEGSWTLTSGLPAGRASRCEWFFREAAQADTASLAEAHRRAVTRLAASIGTNLAAAARGEPVVCPVRDGAG